MTIFLVSREFRGLAEAGGVKDVVREMAETWNRLGHRSMVILPLYGFIRERFQNLQLLYTGKLEFQTVQTFGVYRLVLDGLEVLLFDLAAFRDKKSVYTYTLEEEQVNLYHPRGSGHLDSGWMNISFQKAVAEYLLEAPIIPEALHCHDGHTAWLPVLLKTSPRYREKLGPVKTLVTIHNAGRGYHQEIQDWDPVVSFLGLDASVLEASRLGSAYDPLAAAGLYSHINTVSPFYAQEIMDPDNQESVGGLGDFFRERGIKLPGIFNGIDPKGKDPRFPEDAGLPQGFDPVHSGEGKSTCRQALICRILYPRDRIYGNLDKSEGTVLFSMQSRLTGQKGVEKLIRILPSLLPDPRISFVIMGEGEARYEKALQEVARQWESSGRFAFINTYDESYSPLVFAAGDFFLIPSLYEPCGLTDLKSLLMGNVPIVHGVGGLKKISHLRTGLVISDLEGGLEGTIKQAADLALNTPRKLQEMRREGFEMVIRDFSWDRIVRDQYLKLWREM